MMNDRENTSTPSRPLLHVLYSEKRPLPVSPSRVSPRPTRPREAKTSDFAAYYRQGSSSYCDPVFSVTSHHNRVLPPRPPPTPRSLPPRMPLHTYPCSAITWNPYVQTSSLEDGCEWMDTRCVPPDFKYERDYKLYDNERIDPPFQCRCATCTVRRCPRNDYSSFKPPPPYRTNIMTFRDQWTMTLRLNEAATTVTPEPSCHGSEDSDADCAYVVRDAPQTCTPDCGKTILKNRNDCCKEYAECHRVSEPLYRDQPPPRLEHSPPYYHYPPEPCSPGRDIDPEEEHCIKPSRLSYFFKFRKEKDPTHIYLPRRQLYNEGISDCKAGNLSSCFDRREIIYYDEPSATNVNVPTKGSIKSKCCTIESRSVIPYAHHNDSKFHHACTNPVSFGGSVVPHPRRVVPSSRINKTPMPCNYPALQFTAPSKNPRKLLSSVRDVDSYAEGPTYASTLRLRRQNRN